MLAPAGPRCAFLGAGDKVELDRLLGWDLVDSEQLGTHPDFGTAVGWVFDGVRTQILVRGSGS